MLVDKEGHVIGVLWERECPFKSVDYFSYMWLGEQKEISEEDCATMQPTVKTHFRDSHIILSLCASTFLILR